MKAKCPHGAQLVEGKAHPVFDLKYWTSIYPLNAARMFPARIESPCELSLIEQAREIDREYGDFADSVPADIFVWSDCFRLDPKPITQIGGIPWRCLDKEWPTDSRGVPLQFIAQISFEDSADILPFELPGSVALIFARWDDGSIWAGESAFVLEWSNQKIENPLTTWQIDPGMLLPFCYEGVIHRTVQHATYNPYEEPSMAAESEDEGWDTSDTSDTLDTWDTWNTWDTTSVQATSVGTYARLPQGWPYEEGDGNTLIATLSSFYFSGDWPLCNVRQPLMHSRPDGTEYQSTHVNALSLGIADAGALWIYRDSNGDFLLDTAC